MVGIGLLALVLALSGCTINIGSAKPPVKSSPATTSPAQETSPSKPIASTSKPAHVLAADTYYPQGKWCPTNHLCIESVKWDKYTSNSAEGSGVIRACPPTAAESPCSDVPVRIQFTDPQELCGKTRFSSLTLTSDSEQATFYLDNACNIYQGDEETFLNPANNSSARSNQLPGFIDCPASTKNSRATSARNMSCDEAQADIDATSIAPGSFYSNQEFLCNASGGPKSYGPSYRCTQGNRAYRFDWSD